MLTDHTEHDPTSPVRLACKGVPPDLQHDTGEEAAPIPESRPLLLTAAEVEVMLCFTLSSPLHYGPIEEGLCDKLRRHLRGVYVFRAAPAPEG